MDEGGLDILGQVLHQPASREVDHGLRRAVVLVAFPHPVHERFRRDGLEHGIEAGSGEIDPVDAGEHLAALPGETGPHVGERVGTHDPGAEGLAVEPLHDEALAEPVGCGEHVVHLGFGYAGGAGSHH